jgi:hypothetical protein
MTRTVADARQHQGAQRVVDHRLVVDRQQLLADALRDRIQPGAGAAGEDDAFERLVWKVAQGSLLSSLQAESDVALDQR